MTLDTKVLSVVMVTTKVVKEHLIIVSRDSLNLILGAESKDSVWDIPVQAYSGDHFAVYTPKLIETLS